MMTRRRLIAVGVTGVAGLAAAVSSAWRTGGVDAAETFEVTHSDAEWRNIHRVYAVLRIIHDRQKGMTVTCPTVTGKML